MSRWAAAVPLLGALLLFACSSIIGPLAPTPPALAASADVPRNQSDAADRAPRNQSGADRPPHILLVMADQFRHDAMSGGLVPYPKTPALDRLRREGAWFELHYTSTPSCTPSRAAILTGRSPWRHGMLGFGDIALSYPYAELPRALKSAGYRTVSVGKCHFYNVMSGGKNPSHGFDVRHTYDGIAAEFDTYDTWFNSTLPGADPLLTGTAEFGMDLNWDDYRGAPYAYPERLHPTAWVGAVARAALRTHLNDTSTTTPMFLKASFHRPHSPYDPPLRHLESSSPRDMRRPSIATDRWDSVYAVGNFSTDSYGFAPADMFCGDIGVSSVLRSRAAYMASVAFVDEQIDSVLDTLDALDVTDRTFVLFTADHGDQLGDHYLWRKGFPYEGSAHVPLIVRWPQTGTWRGIAADLRGVRVSAFVTEHRDILPTLLDAAGATDILTEEEQVDGRTVLDVLRLPKRVAAASGDAAAADARATLGWREWIDLEHDPGTLGDVCFAGQVNHWNALTDGSWKYVYNAHNATEQLFDLASDPGERADLHASPREQPRLEMWRARLVAHFERECRGALWVKDGALQRRRISTLYSPFYPTDVYNRTWTGPPQGCDAAR